MTHKLPTDRRSRAKRSYLPICSRTALLLPLVTFRWVVVHLVDNLADAKATVVPPISSSSSGRPAAAAPAAASATSSSSTPRPDADCRGCGRRAGGGTGAGSGKPCSASFAVVPASKFLVRHMVHKMMNTAAAHMTTFVRMLSQSRHGSRSCAAPRNKSPSLDPLSRSPRAGL